ncbi:MAG: GGDEF domain-containing protein, partial [Bradyrhizobium sp.]|nr:GGDEF domain-containing protein [Bradyrhizobium sp.]
AVWDGSEDADSLYRRADRMLYQAKRLGRNRVCA